MGKRTSGFCKFVGFVIVTKTFIIFLSYYLCSIEIVYSTFWLHSIHSMFSIFTNLSNKGGKKKAKKIKKQKNEQPWTLAYSLVFQTIRSPFKLFFWVQAN
jgi:hypothetical protein